VLLDAHGIDTPLTSLHDHNELKKSEYLISRLREGTDIAYVSDAGTPGISDPGYLFVNHAIAQSIKIIPVPGPVAAVAALNASGLPMDSFVFFGFLPSRRTKRRQFLESVREEPKTMVFYESPNRLVSALEDIREILGERQIAVSRELTKLYEETLRGTADEIIESFRGKRVKGEITIVASGADADRSTVSPEEIRARFHETRKDSASSTRDIINALSEEMNVPRKEVYRHVLAFIEEESHDESS